MAIFDLTEIQAQYILDTPLRRLTRFDQLELERERETLQAEIAELTAILDSEPAAARAGLRRAGRAWPSGSRTPRRTVLLEGSGATRTAAVPLEVADDPCTGAAVLGRPAGPHRGRPRADPDGAARPLGHRGRQRGRGGRRPARRARRDRLVRDGHRRAARSACSPRAAG